MLLFTRKAIQDAFLRGTYDTDNVHFIVASHLPVT